MEGGDKCLQDFNTLGFDFATHQRTCAISLITLSACMQTRVTTRTHLCNLFQLGIIMLKKGQVLVGDIHFRIAPVLSMLLDGILATRKGVLVDLGLDLFRGIRHKDGRCRHRSGHFRARTLQGREKFRMDQGRFHVLEAACRITRYPKVRVLGNIMSSS